MITKETSSNKSEYQKLYDKVSQVLNSEYVSDDDKNTLGETLKLTDNGKFRVTSIDEYFSVLEILAKVVKTVVSNNKGYDAKLYNDKLFIIPFGENDFVIDANSRKIGVPQEFARNGVGVEGDHFVESLYFTIDRYFDTIDFAQSNIMAIVEWINANGEKCYSPAWTKILSDDDEKLIIGWVLTDKATKKAGIVKFSIRLYSLDEDGKLESSFATLVTNVIINPSMNFDLEAASEDKIEPEFASSGLAHEAVFKRLRSSPAANKTANDVDLPEYVIRYAKMTNGKIADAGSFNIDDADAGDIYYVWAKSNSGTIRYAWTTTGAAFDENATNSYEYVPVSFWDEGMEYYTKEQINGENKYILAEDVTSSTVASGDYYAIMGRAILPSNGNVTGEYRCLAKNSQYGYTRPEAFTDIDGLKDEAYKIGKITIKGPEDFAFVLSNSEAQVVGTVLNIVNEEDKNDRAVSSHQWKYKTFVDGAECVNKGTESNQPTDAEGYWQATVSHTKNGATKSKTSEDVIVYQPVTMPVADEQNATSITMNPQAKTDVEWRFTVSGDYNQYSYQWYKQNNAATSTFDALTNSKGIMKIENGAIVAKLNKADLADINSIAKFKLTITGKKAIPNITQDIGVISWDWDGNKLLTIDFATIGG